MIKITENEKSIASKGTYPRLMLGGSRPSIAFSDTDIYYLDEGQKAYLSIETFEDYNGKLTLENGD